jgi:diguanylate cyclase (GGDEF)-like protein
VLADLGAYDTVSARRSGAGILAVFAAIDLIGTQAIPVGPVLSIFVGFVVPALLLGWAALLLKGRSAWIDSMLVISPLLATVLICVLNLMTHDASPGGQIAFCAPVLYAASQLRRTAAVAALLAALVGEVVTVTLLKPLDQAVVDFSYVSVILVVITVLLISAGRRQNRLVDQLAQLAAVDPLTGLVTRRVLDDAAHRELSGVEHGTGTALVLLDIDYFKTVNDTYGHPVGDDVLAHVAETVRKHAETSAVISRLGGDEIAVLMPRCDMQTAIGTAERFVECVRQNPMPRADGGLELSVSAGVGFAVRNGLSLRELYAAADASLYQAKRSGRGRVGQPDTGSFTRSVPPQRGLA